MEIKILGGRWLSFLGEKEEWIILKGANVKIKPTWFWKYFEVRIACNIPVIWEWYDEKKMWWLYWKFDPN